MTANLGFSRLGLSREEQHRKEAERRDIKQNVAETRLMTRGMKRAFREASRSGNAGAMADILTMAKENNIPMGGGIRRAGDLERAAANRYYEDKRAWENTRAQTKAAPLRREARDMVAAFGAGEITQEELLRQGRAIGGNTQSIMGLAHKMGFKDRFSKNVKSHSGVTQPAEGGVTEARGSDEGPLQKAVVRTPAYRGIWEDSEHNPNRFADMRRESPIVTEESYEEDSTPPDAATELAPLAGVEKRPSPTVERILKKGREVYKQSQREIAEKYPHVVNLSERMRQDRLESDKRYAESKDRSRRTRDLVRSNDADLDEISKRREEIRLRLEARARGEYFGDEKLWRDQMDKLAGIRRQTAVNSYENMQKNSNRGYLGIGLVGYARDSPEVEKTNEMLYTSSPDSLSDLSGAELKAYLDKMPIQDEISIDDYNRVLANTIAIQEKSLGRNKRNRQQFGGDTGPFGTFTRQLQNIPKEASSLMRRIIDYPYDSM